AVHLIEQLRVGMQIAAPARHFVLEGGGAIDDRHLGNPRQKRAAATGQTVPAARQGSKSLLTGQGGPRAWLPASASAAKAKIETLRLPGGLDHLEVGTAGGIGLARCPGGPLRPLLAPDAEQA